MDKKYVDFICSIHGYMIRVKEIHWNTDNNAEHLLCDEIEFAISFFFEDTLNKVNDYIEEFLKSSLD